MGSNSAIWSPEWPKIGMIIVSFYVRASVDQVLNDGMFLSKPSDSARVETGVETVGRPHDAVF